MYYKILHINFLQNQLPAQQTDTFFKPLNEFKTCSKLSLRKYENSKVWQKFYSEYSIK